MILAAGTATVKLVQALALLGAALVGLSMLTGMLALVLRAAETTKITLRAWLAMVWLATLAVPALAWGLFVFGYALLQRADTTQVYALNPAALGALEIAVPLVTLLLTMAVVAWLTGHTVLRPLAAMRQAARQIATGDLDIRLADPPLRELADVADAFGAMGDALTAALERQAELERQRRLLISAVVHDLRTPLFSLRGHLEGLERGIAETPERTTHYLAVSRQQADSLERLVDDLFTFTRLDYLEETPRRAPLDFAALIHTAAEAARPRAAEKGIALVAQGPERYAIEGDAHLLTRAVENLLDNALRYTPPGGHIGVSWENSASGCYFVVADDGPGIALADLPHVFEPLYRGEASRNRATGGAGLGLAVAQRILRVHGGSLGAANGAYGGAEFTGWLPVAHVHQEDEATQSVDRTPTNGHAEVL
jgi:signal transduction histidine kinase